MKLIQSLDESSFLCKALVFSTVAAMHLFFYQIATHEYRPFQIDIRDNEGLRIQYIQVVRGPILESHPAGDDQHTSIARKSLKSTRSISPQSRNNPTIPARARSNPTRETDTNSTQKSSEAVVSNDALVLKLNEDKSIALDYRKDIFEVRTPNSLTARQPDRFRMRKKTNGKDVIEGAAQFLGLWPPGYTTDPCPRIRRNIGDLLNDTRPASKDLLNEELRRQHSYCL